MLRSPPVELAWAGWRSDTYSLQQHGWDLSVELCDDYERAYRIALRNEALGIYALSSRCVVERGDHVFSDSRRLPIFRICAMTHDIQVYSTRSVNPFCGFEPIDATPRAETLEAVSMANGNIFASVRKAEQVLVDKADMTVIEHLEAIKRLQSDKQRELRARVLDARVRPERGMPQLRIVAQLMSYEEAA